MPNKVYRKILHMGIQNEMEYRTNYWIQLVSFFVPMMTQFFLWLAIFRSSGQGTIVGYTFQEMLIYIIMAAVTSKLVAAGFEYEIAGDIKEGGLGKFLVQPLNYFAYRILKFLGAKAVQSVLVIIFAAVVLIWLRIGLHVPVGWDSALRYLIALPGALLLNFVIYYALSGIAFWLTESTGLFYTLSLIIYIASGSVFPLTIFGATIAKILGMLPFSYIVFFPVNMITGKLTTTEAITGIGMQWLWIAVILVVARWVWSSGVRRYVAVGG